MSRRYRLLYLRSAYILHRTVSLGIPRFHPLPRRSHGHPIIAIHAPLLQVFQLVTGSVGTRNGRTILGASAGIHQPHPRKPHYQSWTHRLQVIKSPLCLLRIRCLGESDKRMKIRPTPLLMRSHCRQIRPRTRSALCHHRRAYHGANDKKTMTRLTPLPMTSRSQLTHLQMRSA